MDAMCYPLDVTTTVGDTPAALGNRIAAAVIAAGLADGSNEANGYASIPTTSRSTRRWSWPAGHDDDRPQPLAAAPDRAHDLAERDPRDQRRPAGRRAGLGPRRDVRPARRAGRWACRSIPGRRRGSAIPPPTRRSRTRPIEIIRLSSQLDPTTRTHGRHLARRDRQQRRSGPTTAPATRSTRSPDSRTRRTSSNQGDFGACHGGVLGGRTELRDPARALERARQPRPPTRSRRTSGSVARVPCLDRLQWDVKLYLALNGAVHDAAIAAWGLKGYYDSVRPISMIRYMGEKGQSSDPAQPSYDKEGLPLVPGLVELITRATTAPGPAPRGAGRPRGRDRDPGLGRATGQDPKTQIGGVAWILAADWVPYQACRPSSRRRSRRTRPATARSAGRRRRC